MEIRFHLDEHVDRALALGLRSHGIDVTTTPEAGLLGAVDDDHLAFGYAEGRVVVTFDHGFLRLHAQGRPHAGIAYCRPGARGIGEVLHMLVLMHACMGADEISGRLEYL